MGARIGIIMGSDSDWKIMEKAAEVLDSFSVPYEVVVASAHRTPGAVHEFVHKMEEGGAKAIIAGAGAAAHLPGVIASATCLPVIGIPINGTSLQGMDALLSIVQMPSGMPVATMAIDGAKNGALFAVQLLATSDESLAKAYVKYREDMASAVAAKNAALQAKLNK